MHFFDRLVERTARRIATIHDDCAAVRHDVVRNAAFDADDLQRLAIVETVDVDSRGVEARHAFEQRDGLVNRVDAHPRTRRVSARAVERGPYVDRALAAGLDPAA